MTTIELTASQQLVLQAVQGKPIDVVDPATQQRYVLLALEQYERVRPLLEKGAGFEIPEDLVAVPPRILQSQQAYWRDLPRLLSHKRLLGRWVCYHRDQRIGIGAYEDLIRECLRQDIPDDAYYLGLIEPHALAPWEVEEIEPGGHIVDEIEIFDRPVNPVEPA